MRPQFTISILAVALAGCAPITPQRHLSLSNPANPQAASAAYPPAAPFLMAGTNYAMEAQPQEESMPEHQHGQEATAPAARQEHQNHNTPK